VWDARKQPGKGGARCKGKKAGQTEERKGKKRRIQALTEVLSKPK